MTKLIRKLGSWPSWRLRLLEFSIALIIVSSILFISNVISERQRIGLPAESWFMVNEIYVPDHAVGSNPEIIYDRSILQPFRGFWVAEVQREEEGGLFSLACQGSGISEYDPEDFLPGNRVNWEWFLERPCVVPPGRYRLRVSWRMKRDQWPDKTLVAVSNMFTVTGPSIGSTPERNPDN